MPEIAGLCAVCETALFSTVVFAASFFWIQSHVPDEGARTLLFDLDQAIQSLTQQHTPDDPQLLRLTGVYHNLLRRWAQT